LCQQFRAEIHVGAPAIVLGFTAGFRHLHGATVGLTTYRTVAGIDGRFSADWNGRVHGKVA
jgi:hypothetical protein